MSRMAKGPPDPLFKTSARADSQRRRSPFATTARARGVHRNWKGSAMQNRINIDHIHSRAIAQEIGERLRAYLRDEPELSGVPNADQPAVHSLLKRRVGNEPHKDATRGDRWQLSWSRWRTIAMRRCDRNSCLWAGGPFCRLAATPKAVHTDRRPVGGSTSSVRESVFASGRWLTAAKLKKHWRRSWG
jgi:hypothetical protein